MVKKSKRNDKDILEELRGALVKHFSEQRQIGKREETRRKRMRNTRELSFTFGKGKIPEWKTRLSSNSKGSVLAAKAWYQVNGYATRARVKTLKSGKRKYYLDIYNNVAFK